MSAARNLTGGVVVLVLLLSAGCTATPAAVPVTSPVQSTAALLSSRAPVSPPSAALSPPTVTVTATISPPTTAAVDRQNPNMAGCNVGAVSVPGSAVPVYLPGGRQLYGILLLRRSIACRALWGRVESITLAGALLSLAITRGPDTLPPFVTTAAGPGVPAYSDLFLVTPGRCISATASVAGGPVARTPCIAG